MSETKPLDAVDMEFQYYSSLINNLVLWLPNRCEQNLATAWFRKLSDPVYNAAMLRAKRNQYLLMLAICMTLNGLKNPFDKFPPEGTLKELFENLKKLKPTPVAQSQPAKESQNDRKTCDLHDTACPEDKDNIGMVMDGQFKFLINLAKQFVCPLSDPSNRRRGRKWINYLSSIKSNCLQMKGVRNDYTMLLSGYLLNDELPGPFIQLPIEKIVPLEVLINTVDMSNHMVIDPSHPKSLKFFRDVPHPEEGAFAFIAVSGEIYDSCVHGK